ncbi:ABC transporter permease [Paenibacillus apii]|nr:ABC transporter permease subunit [Paenibacillus apii]
MAVEHTSLMKTSGKSTGKLTGNSTGLSNKWRQIKKYRNLYWMLLPTLIYFFIFHYIPFAGISIAFKDFQPFVGIADSPWVGLKHFSMIYHSEDFYQLLVNTLLISGYRLIFGFPVPIIFALLLNEVRKQSVKKTVQTITYFPHFLSWIVYGGLILSFISPAGIINEILKGFGIPAIDFVTGPDYFRSILVITGILKDFGWGAIIYLAALSSIDPQLYEAATVDGSGRWKKMIHVTLPALLPTVFLMLIIQIGYILDAGFEQIFVMSNPTVYGVSDIFDTYVYRIGIEQANFSEATAIGLFKGVVGFILIVSANRIIKRSGEPTLW